MLDRLPAFLIEDVGEWGCRRCYVGDCKVLLRGRGCEEEREVEDLRERVGDVARWNGEFAVGGYIERDVEEVAAHGREGLGLSILLAQIL